MALCLSCDAEVSSGGFWHRMQPIELLFPLIECALGHTILGFGFCESMASFIKKDGFISE